MVDNTAPAVCVAPGRDVGDVPRDCSVLALLASLVVVVQLGKLGVHGVLVVIVFTGPAVVGP